VCKGECVVRREHNNEGFIVAWYAIDNNYMFRPSGFYKFEEKRQAICNIYVGAEISDSLWRFILHPY
jgi:uncharacterized protein YhbP (UPF0306 family)